jgi:hypothetical protein
VGDVASRVGPEGLVDEVGVKCPGGAIGILFIAQYRVAWRVRDGRCSLQQAAKQEELLVVAEEGAVFVVRSPVVSVPAASAQRAQAGRDVLGRVERRAEVERVNDTQPVVCRESTSCRRKMRWLLTVVDGHAGGAIGEARLPP